MFLIAFCVFNWPRTLLLISRTMPHTYKNKHLLNPLLGLFFYAFYIFLHSHICPEPYAMISSLLVIFVVNMAVAKWLKFRIYTLILMSCISVTAIACAGVLWIFGSSWIQLSHTYVLIGEIAIVIQLMIFHLNKVFLKARLVKKKAKPVERTLIEDIFSTTTALQYALTLHVFLLFAYKQISFGYNHNLIDHIVYEILAIVIITSFYLLQAYRAAMISRRLEKEEWLPIVTEQGEVTGKIAKKVSVNMENKHLHPVVRIALVSQGKLFLQPRAANAVLDPEKLDHPFEKYILFSHDIDVAIENSIKQIVGREVEEEPKFVFQYVFENKKTKRLILLYLIEVEDESKVKRQGRITGKFWTVKQIDEEFNNQIFSECFELEYEYIKHVILLNDVDLLMATTDDIK